MVEGLGRIGATVNDMAHVLPACKRTIAERMADPESDFRTAFEKGRSLLNSSLRRKQIQVAMSGSVPMLIWLGKQLLGQQDRQYQQVENLGAIIDTLVQVAEAAKEAGDDARVAAALDALDRMRNGEDPQAVYAEWLTAQRPPLADGARAPDVDERRRPPSEFEVEHPDVILRERAGLVEKRPGGS